MLQANDLNADDDRLLRDFISLFLCEFLLRTVKTAFGQPGLSSIYATTQPLQHYQILTLKCVFVGGS